MSDAFFEPLAEHRFRATVHTTGPWSADTQHGGPPGALLAHHLAALDGGEDKRLAKMSIELLRPVPVADLEVELETVRPGRKVDLVAGTISDEDGPLLLARAWRHQTSEVEVPVVAYRQPAPPPPSSGEWVPFFEVEAEVGYHTAMDWRAIEGSFVEPGPATLWIRPTIDLIAGQGPATPLERVLLAADSGNGISATADFHTMLFVNTDLTIHLHRYPAGEWVGMSARTTIEPDGIGLAATDLFDEGGAIGRSAQALYVESRS